MRMPILPPSHPALPLEALPGPRPWPLVGNLPRIDSLRMHERLEQWVEEFGPLYRLRLGRREALAMLEMKRVLATLARKSH